MNIIDAECPTPDRINKIKIKVLILLENYRPGNTDRDHASIFLFLLLVSLQSSQTEEQREELEWVESTSEKRIKVVKIRKEGKTDQLTDQHEDLEMERSLTRSDAGENLGFDMEASEQILEVMREKIEREGDGEKIHSGVMYEQRTQELHARQFREVFFEQRTRGMEAVDTVHEMMLKSGQIVSEENIETLEETLQEVQSIEQRLQDLERVKVRLQEVELLEQRLLQAGRRQRESDDWYVLLEHKLIKSSAPKRLIEVKSGERRLQELERGEKGDWYLLLDQKPMVITSASGGMHILSDL